MTFQNIRCEKCDHNIYPKDNQTTIKCHNCGAFYALSGSVECSIDKVAIFDFVEYKCLHRGLASDRSSGNMYEDCNNTCPIAGMYCKDHCTEKDIESAKSSVSYAYKRLKDSEEHLDVLRESKKVWLIKEISGIDEEDSVPEN